MITVIYIFARIGTRVSRRGPNFACLISRENKHTNLIHGIHYRPSAWSYMKAPSRRVSHYARENSITSNSGCHNTDESRVWGLFRFSIAFTSHLSSTHSAISGTRCGHQSPNALNAVTHMPVRLRSGSKQDEACPSFDSPNSSQGFELGASNVCLVGENLMCSVPEM